MTDSIILPELILAGDFVMKPGWILQPRALQDYEFIYFPKGSNTAYTIGEQTYVLDRPSLIILRPGVHHTCQFDKEIPTRHQFLRFNWPQASSPESMFPLLAHYQPSCIPLEDTGLIPLLYKKIMETFHNRLWNGADRCRVLFYTLLCEAEDWARVLQGPDNSKKIPPELFQAQEYIRQHIQRHTLTVAEVAKAIGWSREYFSRQYNLYFGNTPREAIIQQRIDLASELILKENLKIKEIADRVGFEDVHYFSRSFHKNKGISASEYRKKYAHPRGRHLVGLEDASVLYPLNQYFQLNKE